MGEPTSSRAGGRPAAILVGVDEIGLSDHAVRRGLDLGERLGARVELVHAVPTPPDFWPGIDPVLGARWNAELVARRREAIDGRVRGLLRGSSAPGNELVVVEGPPAKVLVERARILDADLLVLGAHRKRGGLDFGSTLRAVFSKAATSVWIQAQPVAAIGTILAPVDRSKESLEALSLACSLAETFGAKVRAVECFHTGSLFVGGLDLTGYGATFPVHEVRRAEQAGFERAMAAFDWKGAEHTTEFLSGEPVEEILGMSSSADLIVLGTHGRTGLASVLLGGVAYAVLKGSEKPVLAVRHAERGFLL